MGEQRRPIHVPHEVKIIHRLVVWYRANHDGQTPTPKWVVTAMSEDHPAIQSSLEVACEMLEPQYYFEIAREMNRWQAALRKAFVRKFRKKDKGRE